MTDLRTNILNRIAAEQSKAKTHASVVTYSNGHEIRVEHNNAASAQNFANGYARHLGAEYAVAGEQITLVSSVVVAL